MRQLNQSSLSNPKLKVINKDAYIWVKENSKKYGVIIIDFPDPSNYSLGKLYSLQFYRELERLTSLDTKIVVQTTSPYFAPKSFWCIEKTINQIFPFTSAYHTYVPSFGEWGFSIASFEPINNKIYRKIPNLKFYDYNFSQLSYFTKDMKAKDIEVNRLDNQILVRYFDEEWGKVQ